MWPNKVILICVPWHGGFNYVLCLLGLQVGSGGDLEEFISRVMVNKYTYTL